MEKASRHYKQPKMKQKDYFVMLENGYQGKQFSQQFQFNSKQPKIKQGDLLYVLHKQLEDDSESLNNSVQLSVNSVNSTNSHRQRGGSLQDYFIYKKEKHPKTRMVRKTPVNSENLLMNKGVINQSELQPRSILKKAKDAYMTNNLHNNNADNLQNNNDLIFEETFSEEFISPRDAVLLSHRAGSQQLQNVNNGHSVNYTEESPQTVKSVNFNNGLLQRHDVHSSINDPIQGPEFYGSIQSASSSSSNRQTLTKEEIVDFGSLMTNKMAKVKLKNQGKATQKILNPNQQFEKNAQLVDVKLIGSPKVLHANGNGLDNRSALLVSDGAGSKTFMSQELLY